MKLYEKIINGQQHCKPASKIIIIKDGMQTFNPTEEMLLADGWKVHVPVMYEPTEEEINQNLLIDEKEHLKNDIIRYDSSEDVNIFYVQDQPIWIDKTTRQTLLFRFQVEQKQGLSETKLWYNNKQYIFNIDAAFNMLYAIEAYAIQCYDNTQRHLAAIEELTTLDELKNYDYRTGYPEKLRF